MYLNTLKLQITDLILHLILLIQQLIINKPNVQPSYMRQQSEQSEQSELESPTQETLVNLFQNPDSPLRQPQLQVSDIQLPNPSETNIIHNTSEFSEETVQNTKSFTITDDSNLIIIPTHTITQNEITNQNQDNTSSTNPDNTSVLSTSNTTITHPSHTQILSTFCSTSILNSDKYP